MNYLHQEGTPRTVFSPYNGHPYPQNILSHIRKNPPHPNSQYPCPFTRKKPLPSEQPLPSIRKNSPALRMVSPLYKDGPPRTLRMVLVVLASPKGNTRLQLRMVSTPHLQKGPPHHPQNGLFPAPKTHVLLPPATATYRLVRTGCSLSPQ